MAEKLCREDYWNKFALALKPNTTFKAWTAAQKAKQSVAVDLVEDENGNLVNPAEGHLRRKSKKINPQQLENEESDLRRSASQQDNSCSLIVANKECQKCLQCFVEVSYGLSDLSDANATIKSKKPIKDVESGETSPFTEMAKHMVRQTKDSFVIAYKLNETALGFHVAEDFLRDPKISTLDFSAKGRIRIPTLEYTEVTLNQLGQLLNDSLTIVDVFEENFPKEKPMICLLNIFAKGLKHLEASAEHCKNVFESLLYICGQGMDVLQKFVCNLNSFERSDVIMEVQSLRRRIDEIAIVLEKLSWKSHLILHRSKGFPVRFTSAMVNKTNAKPSSAKQRNVKVKKPGPTTPASNKTKLKKIKVSRKKTVVDQFIKNQKHLQGNEETANFDSEEGDSEQ